MRDYWVIDTTRLRTTVHKTPVEGAWTSVEIVPAEMPLQHPGAAGFSVRLADI